MKGYIALKAWSLSKARGRQREELRRLVRRADWKQVSGAIFAYVLVASFHLASFAE